MKKEQKWPDDLQELIERIASIAANDEFELRVAVHDLQTHAVRSSHKDRHVADAILQSCCDLIRQAAHQLSPDGGDKVLGSFRSKPYIRSINALIRTLLPESGDAQHGLALDGLQLHECNLEHIDLSGSSLRMTDFSRSKLSRASFGRCDLRFAAFTGASLLSADFAHSLMEHCAMAWCDLSRVDMQRCQLMYADMGGSILERAKLSHALLSGADMANATLTGADLRHANLFAARLHSAKLSGCNLTGTGITPERLENAGMSFQADSKTLWGSEDDCHGRNPLDPAYYCEQQRLL